MGEGTFPLLPVMDVKKSPGKDDRGRPNGERYLAAIPQVGGLHHLYGRRAA